MSRHREVAPAGTPAAIVELLARQIVQFVARPQARERLASFGFTPVGSTPDEYSAQIRADIDNATRVVREAGIKME